MGGEYKKGMGNLLGSKGKILAGWLMFMVKLSHMHYTCNIASRGTNCGDFKMHVILLSYVHPRNFDVT